MKNKFKKSKIIVPALALITATTVASVTGTVAWFTATRSINVSASTFIATKLESTLKVTCTGRIGTASTNNNQGITTTTGTNVSNKLTHGSYDAQAITRTAAGNLYVAKVNDDGKTVDSFTNLGTEATNQNVTATSSTENWLARSSTSEKIWYGVSWQMKFELEAATTNTADYLFFDVAGSTFTNSQQNSTAGGFRIAFMTSSKVLVIGGDDTKTHVGTNTTLYTKATSFTENTTYYTYDSTTKVYSLPTTQPTSESFSASDYYTKTPTYSSFADNNYAAITDTTAKASDVTDTDTLNAMKFNLGSVGVSNTDTTKDKSLTITCVAWYEGSDANVMNSNSSGEISMSQITASLNFYTRSVHA